MYVYPIIGKKPVNEIGIDDIVKVLKPIRTTKPPSLGEHNGLVPRSGS
jgi:hypothetical protein